MPRIRTLAKPFVPLSTVKVLTGCVDEGEDGVNIASAQSERRIPASIVPRQGNDARGAQGAEDAAGAADYWMYCKPSRKRAALQQQDIVLYGRRAYRILDVFEPITDGLNDVVRVALAYAGIAPVRVVKTVRYLLTDPRGTNRLVVNGERLVVGGGNA